MKVCALVLLLSAAGHAQSWHVGQDPWRLTMLPQAAIGDGETVPPRYRITASKQTLATLRAVMRERVPEGTALYTVRVCNLAPAGIGIDPGTVEQAMERRGIAVSTRPLTQATARRTRSLGASIMARVGEVAQIAAPMVLGAAAGGVIQLSGPWAAGVAALGTGLRIVGDASRPELDAINASVGDLGEWLADAKWITLAAGQCSSRLLVLGSYRRGQAETLAIEETK